MTGTIGHTHKYATGRSETIEDREKGYFLSESKAYSFYKMVVNV